MIPWRFRIIEVRRRCVWVGGVVMERGGLKGYYVLYEHVLGIVQPPVVDFAVLLVLS